VPFIAKGGGTDDGSTASDGRIVVNRRLNSHRAYPFELLYGYTDFRFCWKPDGHPIVASVQHCVPLYVLGSITLK